MELYIYIEAEELEDVAEPMVEAIVPWIGNKNEKTKLVNQIAEGFVGVNMTVTSKNGLKKPLIFLYDLAKEHKCDFVVGILDTETGAMEDVCYFGHEEGRPDMFEIGSYLGL
ncbi:hypothetical protein A9Q99_14215 [Gammaproteobacteria bacterium 45_16_T64]|nr:hypothetical protein A9Q99_14215 [Gammaproteobacteria bacterium 45_16_T64]